jgi:hypothetical protein
MKNNTFDKAKETKSNKKPWYIINGKRYSYYIWALPLVPFVTLYEKIDDWADSRRVWSAERATKVLNHVLPKVLEWVEEDKAYYYCMEWGTSNLWRGAKRIDRKWARKHEYKLREFIREGYENEHYNKSVEQDYYETWVKFEERV